MKPAHQMAVDHTAIWTGRVNPAERFCGLDYDEMRTAHVGDAAFPDLDEVTIGVGEFNWLRVNYSRLW